MNDKTLYDKFVRKLGFIGFISFFMVFVSILIELCFVALHLSPKTPPKMIPGLKPIMILPTLFFGTTFFSFGLMELLPNRITIKKVSGLTGLFWASLCTLFGLVPLLLGIYVAWTMQPLYLYVFASILIFWLVPKGILKSKRAMSINFSPNGISLITEEGSVTYPYNEINRILIIGHHDGLTIKSNKGTVAYDTDIPFEDLRKNLGTLDCFKTKEMLLMNSNGKSLEEILNVSVIDNKSFQIRTRPGAGRNPRPIEEVYLQQYDQWLELGEPYIFYITYENKTPVTVPSNYKWIINVLLLLFVLILLLVVGYIFIPHKIY